MAGVLCIDCEFFVECEKDITPEKLSDCDDFVFDEYELDELRAKAGR